MSEKLLQITSLNASYGDEDVLTGIDLGIDAEEIICLVGESGSGKSTLIKAIHGMSGLRITNGSIRFDGRDITNLPAAERRRIMGTSIGLIPQDPGASFNPIRRFDAQFKEALQSHGLPYDEDLISGMLLTIGLEDAKAVLRNRPYEMSGGMNQRIAIAAAMMFRPRLLMCDEATSALDVTTAGAVVRELVRIRKEQGTAILMVTHHLGIAQRMADRVGIMRKGVMIEYGTVRDVFENPQNEYTKRLITDVPKLKK